MYGDGRELDIAPEGLSSSPAFTTNLLLSLRWPPNLSGPYNLCTENGGRLWDLKNKVPLNLRFHNFLLLPSYIKHILSLFTDA